MIEKTKSYQLLERFLLESIYPLKELSQKETDEHRKAEMESRLAFYEELHQSMFSMIYSHTIFVSESRKFHEEMVKIGFYDKETGDINFNVPPDEVAESYKRILNMYDHYKNYTWGLVPADVVIKVIKSFEKAFGCLLAS